MPMSSSHHRVRNRMKYRFKRGYMEKFMRTGTGRWEWKCLLCKEIVGRQILWHFRFRHKLIYLGNYPIVRQIEETRDKIEKEAKFNKI
jgi:hypothetical protein